MNVGSIAAIAEADSEARRQRFVKLACMIVGGSCLVYLGALPWLAPGPTRAAAPLLFLLVSASVLVLRSRIGAQAAGLLFSYGLFAAILYVGFLNGMRSSAIYALPILIGLSAWLSGPRHAVAIALLAMAGTFGLTLAEVRGMLDRPTAPRPYVIWFALVMLLSIATILAVIVQRAFQLQLDQLNRMGEALAKRVAELDAEKNQLRLIAENVPVMLFHGDSEKRCLYANPSFADFYGRAREDLLGLAVREIIGGEVYDKSVGVLLDRVLAGEKLSYRATRRSAGSESNVLDIDMVPEPGLDGGTCGFFGVFKDVTRQIAIEENLHRSEEKFARAFRSSPLAIAITRIADGRYMDVNEAFVRLFGWRREEVIGRTSLEVGKWLAPEERANWVATLKQAGRISNQEIRFRAKGGDVCDVLLSAEQIDLDGESCALILAADITERKQAEQSRAESEERLRIATAGGGVGIWEWAIASNRLEWNEQLRVIFGLTDTSTKLTLDRFIEAIFPEDRARVQQAFMHALDHHGNFDCEYRIVRPDGSVRWIVARGHGQYGADGSPQRMLGMALDITERKRAEEQFAKVFHASPVAISISRLHDGHYLDANEAFTEQFGWSREEMIGRTSVEVGIWPSETARSKWTAELRKSGKVRSYEATLSTKSGELHSVLISAEQYSLDGEQYVLGLVHDITELRRAESALRKNEARLNEAQRIGHVGSWDLDLPSLRMTWSTELYKIFECEPDTFGGTFADMLPMMHPDDLERIRTVFRDSGKAAGSYEIDHRILTPDGRIKHIHVHWEVFLDTEGKPIRALGTAQDTTAQVLANEEIQHLNASLEDRVRERTAELQSANKELESFAYSISHDLRAPLRGIDGFSHLLAEEYGEQLDAQGKSYLERVRAAAQRMGTLIDDILELSRITRHSMRRSQADLSQLAHDILGELKQGAPAHTVEVSIKDGCSAFGDPQLLRVMMQNLLENAWKYSGKEAAPKIEFGRETVDGERIFFVRDNGVGFDMKYADRLFTPFQRLHKPEEFAGTGVGLATVARIVRRHGGRVWIESALGHGTTIRFTLPR
jgi:PAS domain S-box-containing protein